MGRNRSDPETAPYAVLAPASDEVLAELPLSAKLRAVHKGDPDRVRWMLRGVAANPEGRVAIAVDGGQIVGFVALVAPMSGDRFSGIGSALQLTAAEVAVTHRGTGVFRALFDGALRSDLEERIVFTIADPALRDPRESTRAFRDRIQATLGSLGFFPYPTTHPGVRAHRDTVFLARVGRGVTRSEADEFFACLRYPEERPERIAIFIRNADLRNLIRTDLERHQFEVVAIGGDPGHVSPVDVVVTDFPGVTSAAITVRVVDDDVKHEMNGIIYLPAVHLDRLPGILRREAARMRSTRWPRSSKNAS